MYVAKVFPEYTEREARAQLRRIPFPRFYGVATDLDRSKFRSGYFNRRAIILEALKPDLASRRILAAHTHNVDERIERFHQRLQDIKPSLSAFESDYYNSLFTDRIHRLDTLHNLAITHGDVRDDHFRLPRDFYDTVLYDFSVSYTFSSIPPYLVNLRQPRSLKDISGTEQQFVAEQVYKRAKKLDFRDHLIQSTGATAEDIQNALFQPLQNEELELIIFKVMTRPDAFSIPSVSSVFPFLEILCPQNDSTWHIRRGRQLDYCDTAWVFLEGNSTTLVSISYRKLVDVDLLENESGCYLLGLVPKEWRIETVCDKLLRVYSSLKFANSWGYIIRRIEFDNYS